MNEIILTIIQKPIFIILLPTKINFIMKKLLNIQIEAYEK